MDFLIGKSTPKSDAILERYDTSQQVGEFWLGHVSSGNLEVLKDTSGGKTVVAGSLFGPLADVKNIDGKSKENIGTHAIDSDGSFALAHLQGSAVTVVTDAGGSIPVYYGDGPRGLALGTVVHHVAACSGLTSLDEVSVVDYLLNANVCYPYSWYEQVRLVPPGSVCSFDARGEKTSYTYWEPTEPDDVCDPCDVRKWGERLRKQITNAVELGIQNKKNGRLLYSGGSDSRAILSVVPRSFDCTPTTILDRKNREYRLAKRSANLLGHRLDWIRRPENFYRSGVSDRIDTIGPGRDFQHTHVFGSVASQLERTDVILGGYFSDTILKTLYMSNVERRPDKPEQLSEPMPDTIKERNFMEDISDIFIDRLVEKVQTRREKHHACLKETRPFTAGNWHNLWPASGGLEFGSYMATTRLETEIIEPFVFPQTYKLAAMMPDTARIDSRGFRQAFSEKMGSAGFWPTSSGRIPRFGGKLGHEVMRQIKRWRTLKERLGIEAGYQGSWSPDRLRSAPVRPEDHFDEASCNLLYDRLQGILSGVGPRQFFEMSGHRQAQVRSLSLGFSVS